MKDYFKPEFSKWFYKPRFSFRNIKTARQWIKWSWQRAFRGYADCDLWSIDFYISEILSNMIKDFRENTHGYPNELTPEDWDKILEKIENGFNASKKIQNMEYEGTEEYEALHKIFDEGMDLFKEWYFGLWD